MQRKIVRKLIQWKDSDGKRLPLLVYGARQVGKTYAIQEFARKYYKNNVYVNLERMEDIAQKFNSDISPNTIVPFLESSLNTKIIPEETLIIFDEIQACERALTSLKYFAEEAPEYHLIAAGSLLGVAINRQKYSFPVGKVQMLTLYPVDFEEFLWALDKKWLIDEIRQCYNNNSPMNDLWHQDLLELYRYYLVIGGMPHAINEYVTGKSTLKVSDIQTDILNSYLADMSKYASVNESIKIRGVYDSLPAQLAKENRKFQYKLIRKGATASLFESSLDWLLAAGIVLKCRKVNHGKVPLTAFSDLSSFKIYMSDVGLLTSKAKISYENVILSKNINDFKGALTENYVAQALKCNGYEIYYWESNSIAEVDFVIQKNGEVIPIEVKADVNTRSKSLNVFISKYKPSYAIRISAKNFGFENNIKAIPLYATFLI